MPNSADRLGKKTWAQEVRQHINDEMVNELHDAVSPAQNEKGEWLQPRLKDMVRIDRTIDRVATNPLRKNRKGHAVKQSKTFCLRF